MQGIKDALPDKVVTIDGVADLDRIVRDQQLDEETAAALRHLFDAE